MRFPLMIPRSHPVTDSYRGQRRHTHSGIVRTRHTKTILICLILDGRGLISVWDPLSFADYLRLIDWFITTEIIFVFMLPGYLGGTMPLMSQTYL